MMTLYGISNCDTIKKAKRWLEQAGCDYQFHDYRKAGVDRALLNRFADTLGWEPLVNKRGTTWRRLDESEREDLDRDKALTLLIKHPAMIKRPVLDYSGGLLLGFNIDDYEQALSR